nr:hypothetical protein [Tanacetum cinerariifolium]
HPALDGTHRHADICLDLPDAHFGARAAGAGGALHARRPAAQRHGQPRACYGGASRGVDSRGNTGGAVGAAGLV